MTKPQTTKEQTILGWIGHKSWMRGPLSHTKSDGRQFGTLFSTKKDALAAGWEKPSRVEITLRLL